MSIFTIAFIENHLSRYKVWYWGVILWWQLANETERLSSLKFLGKMPNRDRGFPRVGVGWFSRVRFARSTIPVEKIGTTHSLFLLRHLLAVKRLFWWKNFLLNKEHSRPFEQCWPLRDHLVLCESSSALQTFYHMKNNLWRLLKTLETPKDGVEFRNLHYKSISCPIYSSPRFPKVAD